MKYPDYFSLEVAAYGMTTDEMLKMLDDWMATLRPLYLQLHTWAKYKLAEKFHQPVPKKIPAHWINDRWGQQWPGMVEAADIDKYFEGRKPEWIIKTAEQFYTGLGFSPLPQGFWERSDLYPLPPDSKRKKNTHASCWHVDLQNDIRSLQSIEPNARWFFTAHHELGHGYYFKAYSRPEVPYLLRLGAAPGFHEGVGELIALASSQVPYLQSRGVLPHEFNADKTAFLLDDALARSVPFIYFSCGTCRIGKQTFTRVIFRLITGTRAGGNTSPISKASNRRRCVAKNFATPPPRRTSMIIQRITTTMRLRPCSSFNYTITSLAKSSINHRNHVITLITKKLAPG
jgi:peptidyl-dipeptidase A